VSCKPLRDRPYFIFNDFKDPLLFLLFDLGATVKKLQAVQFSVSDNKSPPIWAIHSKGHGEEVFGCLSSMQCAESSKLLFLQTTPGSNLHDKLASTNRVFSKIDIGFQFPDMRKRRRDTEGER
jgi:hypothetical protein